MVLAQAPQQSSLPPAPLLETLRREVGGSECDSIYPLELGGCELSGPALHLSGQPFRSLFREGRGIGLELRLGEVRIITSHGTGDLRLLRRAQREKQWRELLRHDCLS